MSLPASFYRHHDAALANYWDHHLFLVHQFEDWTSWTEELPATFNKLSLEHFLPSLGEKRNVQYFVWRSSSALFLRSIFSLKSEGKYFFLNFIYMQKQLIVTTSSLCRVFCEETRHRMIGVASNVCDPQQRWIWWCWCCREWRFFVLSWIEKYAIFRDWVRSSKSKMVNWEIGFIANLLPVSSAIFIFRLPSS